MDRKIKIVITFICFVAFQVLLYGSADAQLCTSEVDCDDGLYCNGEEICDPTNPEADSFGCIPAIELPCPITQICNEAEARCDDIPCEDFDGDGHEDIACGGDDCDDNDPDRYPGNREECDAVGHDEDCDPSTLGPDSDGDGYQRIECCNYQPSGSLACGRDCDDDSKEVNPEASEICNGLDENCNGEIDEGVMVNLYEDYDRDGHGNSSLSEISGCPGMAGYSILGNDCDDTNPAIIPGALTCAVERGIMQLCTSEGSFINVECRGKCFPQPNGTGICLGR